jgi:hypothetical protein
MPMQVDKSAINEVYRRDRNFFVLYDQLVLTKKLGFKSTAVDTLDSFEKESMAKARKGLSLGINDILEDTNDWPVEAVREFDRFLSESDAATLTELRVRKSKRYKKILKRGAIRDEMECYLVKVILDGLQEYVEKDELPLLQEMLTAYEKKSTL